MITIKNRTINPVQATTANSSNLLSSKNLLAIGAGLILIIMIAIIK